MNHVHYVAGGGGRGGRAMSSTDVFAEPMLNSDENLEECKKQLTELGKKGLLPNLDAILTYKVYSFSGSNFGAHKSIVLTTTDKHSVTESRVS